MPEIKKLRKKGCIEVDGVIYKQHCNQSREKRAPTQYNAFISEQRKSGKSFAEASQIWKEVKEKKANQE